MACSVLITTADGLVHRLGADEPDAGWVPEALTWTTSLPGGDKDCTFNLRRRIDEDIPLRLRDEVEVVDEGGATMWAGRIAGLPRSHGDDFLVGVQCVGWAAHLKDDESFCELYIDRDLSHWRAPALPRQIVIAAAGPSYSYEVAPDAVSGVSALTLKLHGPWSGVPACESTYDAGATNGVGSIYGEYGVNGNINTTDANWALKIYMTDDEITHTLLEDVRVPIPLSPAVVTRTTTNASTYTRYLMVQLVYLTSAGTEIDYIWWLRRLAVYGRHGLTKRTNPSLPAADPQGFYIGDMIADALGRACPKLNFSVGDGGTIEQPSFVVCQAAYLEPGPVEDIILDLNKYVLWEWLVYNKTFYYRPSDPDRLCWEARLDEGAHLSLEGDDDERTINGVVVTFSLPDGTKKVVGPPGSGMHVESAALSDPNPDNSATVHGYTRAWKKFDITFPTYDDAAVSIGSAYLAETSLPSRSGDMQLVGTIEHPTKGKRPVREVRSGDWVKLSDHPADVPRRIIQTSNTEDSRTCSITVGNDVKKVDALLEQLGVVTSTL